MDEENKLGPTGETVAPAPLAGKSLLTRETLPTSTLQEAGRLAQSKDPTITVGRIVLYQQHPGTYHASIVCRVWANEGVNLKVFDGNGQDYAAASVCKGDGVGEWSFPKRV